MQGKQIRVIKKNNPDSLEYNVGDILTVDSTWYGGVNVTSPSGIPLSLDRDEYEILEAGSPETEKQAKEDEEITEKTAVNHEEKYGLHDCRIKEMKLKDNQLTLKFKTGICKVVGDDSVFVPGKVLFHDTDMDFCYIYILEDIKANGKFKGKRWELKKYIRKHKKLNLEVISVTRNQCETVISGMVWDAREFKEFFLDIYNTGGMEYIEKNVG